MELQQWIGNKRYDATGLSFHPVSFSALQMGSAMFEFFLLFVSDDFNAAHAFGYLTSRVQFVHNTSLLVPSHNSLWTYLVQFGMLYGPVAHTTT